MDIISPAQLKQVRELLCLTDTYRPKALRRNHDQQSYWKSIVQRRPQLPSELAFATIGLLNLPLFLKLQAIKANAALTATSKWTKWSTSTFTGRWLASPLEKIGMKDRFVSARSRWNNAWEMTQLSRKFSLSPQNPFWTWITSAFMHTDAQHLKQNMLALWVLAPLCSAVAEMTTLHVFSITLGSALSSSAAMMMEWKLRHSLLGDFRSAKGASGIVSGFAAIALAAAPTTWIHIAPFGMIRLPCWLFVGIQIFSDIIGLFGLGDIVRKPVEKVSWFAKLTQPKIGYSGHLGGALFGFAYYYSVLRRIRDRESSRRLKEGSGRPLGTNNED